jgi:tetratricopeptide (TPR) repeat protein
MKRYFPVAILILAALYVSTTGFQCGSAELTSAKLYVQQKNWAKAEESCLKEISKNDKNEEAWFILGQVRYEVKKYGGALEAFNKAAEISDAHKAEIVRYRLGIWQFSFNDGVKYYNAGHDTASYYSKALEQFTTAIAAAPDTVMSYYVAARAASALKDRKMALGFLEAAVQKNPKYADAIAFTGELHYSAALENLEAKDEAGANLEFGKSAEAFQKAYELAPDNAATITALIEVYERTKNPGKALEITRAAVAREPGNKVYHYALGVFLLKQAETTAASNTFENSSGEYTESIAEFKRALEIDPAYSDATYNCGVAYLNWGVSVKAEIDKRTEATKGWKPTGAKEEQLYDFKAKFKEGLPFLEKAAETRTDDAALWQQLGRIYALLNMPEKSKTAFERVDKLTKGK